MGIVHGIIPSKDTKAIAKPKYLIQTTRLVLPVSTSYTHPLIVTESGTTFDAFKNSTSLTTAASSSGKVRKSRFFALSSLTAAGLQTAEKETSQPYRSFSSNPPGNQTPPKRRRLNKKRNLPQPLLHKPVRNFIRKR